MRMAILSDIHGNLVALQAVLAKAESLGVEVFHSLGDIVGYGPDPGACIALVRRRVSVSLMGNHDAAVTGATLLDDFNDFARWAAEWTASVLAPEDRAYLAGLPYIFRGDGFFLVHASPFEPEIWHYIHGIAEASPPFEHFPGQICFVGHTHRPFILARDEGSRIVHDQAGGRLRQDHRYLVNAGSVGQPRDHDPRASFVIYDTTRGEIGLHRVAYAVEKTQERMRAAGIPSFLIDRLAVGI